MQIPVEITFRDIERSEAVEARIRDWVEKLERVFDRIVRCEVVVDDPNLDFVLYLTATESGRDLPLSSAVQHGFCRGRY